MNKYIVKQNRDKLCPQLCPIEASLDTVELAMASGVREQKDPLCVFQTEDGTTSYLTGKQVTSYFRWVTKKVFPTISRDELYRFSCHSIQVYAAVMLQEAGKGWRARERCQFCTF